MPDPEAETRPSEENTNADNNLGFVTENTNVNDQCGEYLSKTCDLYDNSSIQSLAPIQSNELRPNNSEDLNDTNEEEWRLVSDADTLNGNDDSHEFESVGSDEELTGNELHLERRQKQHLVEQKTGEESGCAHYKRFCKIVAPCCDTVFWCRHCHNEVKNTANPGEDICGLHEVDRFKVSEIICSQCATRQSVSNKCSHCGIQFAEYFCSHCKFWDDSGSVKQIFHCESCHLCRIGGRENFFHCQTCDCCYPIALQDNHVCVEKAMRSACPICLEDMFNSIKRVTLLYCGHTIHEECLAIMTKDYRGFSSIRCPLCFQSISPTTNLWNRIDAAIAETPMPSEEVRRVIVLCHDCQKKSTSSYHVYGIKCMYCGSYNTAETGTPPPSSHTT